MKKIIKFGCHDICFDEINSWVALVGSRSVRIYDTETLKEIARLSYGVGNLNQAYISHKNGVIVVKNTVGQFGFFSIKDFSLIGKLKVRCSNTDYDFCYDEEENIICGILSKKLGQYVYRISVDTLEYDTFLLEELNRETMVEREYYVTRYELYKYSQGNFYMIRNFYNIGSCGPKVYDCIYGRFQYKDNKLVLKERYLSDTHCLHIPDITEKEAYEKIRKLKQERSLDGYFVKLYRNERGLFLITSRSIYKQKEKGEFEEIYTVNFGADYAEFRGRRYICTWECCIVEDIEE